MDEWRITARLWVDAVREFIGLRLIYWGLLALPGDRLQKVLAKAVAGEIKRQEFVDTLAKGIAELPIEIHKREKA